MITTLWLSRTLTSLERIGYCQKERIGFHLKKTQNLTATLQNVLAHWLSLADLTSLFKRQKSKWWGWPGRTARSLPLQSGKITVCKRLQFCTNCWPFERDNLVLPTMPVEAHWNNSGMLKSVCSHQVPFDHPSGDQKKCYENCCLGTKFCLLILKQVFNWKTNLNVEVVLQIENYQIITIDSKREGIHSAWSSDSIDHTRLLIRMWKYILHLEIDHIWQTQETSIELQVSFYSITIHKIVVLQIQINELICWISISFALWESFTNLQKKSLLVWSYLSE